LYYTVEQLAQQNISPLRDLDQVSLLVVLRDAEQVIMSQIMSPNETAGCQAQPVLRSYIMLNIIEALPDCD